MIIKKKPLKADANDQQKKKKNLRAEIFIKFAKARTLDCVFTVVNVILNCQVDPGFFCHEQE